MAKNVEIGLRFPKGFEIEKSGGYTIYSDNEEDIIRWKFNQVQGHTTQLLSSLVVTPLESGKFTISTWIKAENIASIYRNIEIQVE